jgi:hypothetical protein
MKTINKVLLPILVCVLLIFNLNTANAKDGDNKSKTGIRAGWQYSTIAFDGSIPNGYDPLSSFYAGFFRDNKIIPLLRLGTGIEYSHIGNKSIAADNDSLPSITLQYISIPIDLKVKLGPVFVLGGFSLNFKVAEKWDLNGDKYNPPTNLKAGTFDIPLFLGAGVQIFFIAIEARYYWGMINLYDGNTKTQYLQVGGTISF